MIFVAVHTVIVLAVLLLLTEVAGMVVKVLMRC